MKSTVTGLLLSSLVLLAPGAYALVAEADAKNFLAVATGKIPSSNDPTIKVVESQLNAISKNCSSTSSGPSAHDQLFQAYTDSRVKNPSLLTTLNDFVGVTAVQCRKFSVSMLIALYFLERDDGATHEAALLKVTKSPEALISKWSKRPADR